MVSVMGQFALLGCSRADANILGKGNQVFTFLWNHYPSKNEAREVDVSLLCVCMRLSGLKSILFTFL